MNSPEQSRRATLVGLLSRGPRARIRDLADDILADVDGQFQITRTPETGVISAQVREPLARQRFLVGDIVATQAEVSVCGTTGWGMCLGDDRPTALALAVLDAEIAREGDHLSAVTTLAEDTADMLRERRAQEWSRLKDTIVEFGEIA